MTEGTQKPGVIHRSAVRLVQQPALVDCGTVADGHTAQPIAVVPLLERMEHAWAEVMAALTDAHRH